MTASHPAGLADLATGAAQLFEIRPAPSHSRWARRGARLRVPGTLAARQRQRFLTGLLSAGGLEAACSEAGVSLADALAERIRDQGFRAAWQAADTERLEAVETLYIDFLVASLSVAAKAGNGTAGEGASEAGKLAVQKASVLADKTMLALWQALKDSRRRAPATVSAAPAAPLADPPARVATDDAAEIAAIISRVEAAISTAEAELGLR